ncbi:MAG: metallophosphoesterase family protein [Candidatus Latescibacteria bacterium]|jgi:predicted phosphodiesterase|nr:metallophosphoesterase family protein [Candidatus Latescibacterota bacterium]MDP7633599.1 metallophosphoesterase family protein [Candidatus Latescibacterota bacterium]
MRLAVLSDIHGNLEALEAVLLEIDRLSVDGVIVLGDIVGYGPDPLACIYRIREAAAACVLGNHDEALVDPTHVRELNPVARDTLLRSREMVSEEELAYLRTFAFRHVEADGVFTHANPILPEQWQHLQLFEHIRWCLDELEWHIAFVGHTHHAGMYCKTDHQVVPLPSSELAVGHHRYLVNVGSVGQPRDGDPRACFALWDIAVGRAELRRVEYRYQRTQEKLTALGWPFYAAERLARGE